MDKEEVIKILKEISVLLELKDENPFKIRAYQNSARSLEASDIDFGRDLKIDDLTKIKGIGQHIAESIKELVDTGSLKFYEDLKKTVPPGLVEMLAIPTMGPKKIKYLFDNLQVSNTGELEYACIENRLVDLPNFGRKTQENILKGIEVLKKYKGRYLFANIIEEAEAIHNKIQNFQYVNRSSLAGSVRRKKEIVKDIDIVASTDNPDKVMDFFTGLSEAEDIIARGDTKSSIRLKFGINVDIRSVDDFQYPYALHHFTGSKEHNTAMRTAAKKDSIKMNEYGLFKNDSLIKCSNEADIFNFFSMDWIPPELRENYGEIEAAKNKTLPKLIEEKDIKGIFHIHTTHSDGNISIEQACNYLQKMGFQYAGISEHSRTASYAGGLKDNDINRYLEEIDKLNQKGASFKIFKGIESDILLDGNLDYSDHILSKFDFIIAAIHSGFNLSKEQMTNRIIKAIENKFTTMIAHPTGRLLLARDPYRVDIIRIINAAAENDVDIELNSSPFRLDLDWRMCKYAKEKGVKIFINPDAHSLKNLDDYKFGVNIARKGWLEKEDVPNTLSAKEIEIYLKNKKNKKTK
ncbi:DNA polymerase/3'-5' exonuclease PolX [Candidatus Atribacteria bacterium 1244-E10-H5-B2]|nr:MAG: DNA polymerase/3'-5' exonuclease PolX [Candidatus Atribacteria bacterium 1244-E10-H5-B2]